MLGSLVEWIALGTCFTNKHHLHGKPMSIGQSIEITRNEIVKTHMNTLFSNHLYQTHHPIY
jgi:hypothetical protein